MLYKEANLVRLLYKVSPTFSTAYHSDLNMPFDAYLSFCSSNQVLQTLFFFLIKSYIFFKAVQNVTLPSNFYPDKINVQNSQLQYIFSVPTT